MKHLNSMFSYLFRSLAFFAVSFIISLSLIQNKFPPSITEFTKQMKDLKEMNKLNLKLLDQAKSLDYENLNFETPESTTPNLPTKNLIPSHLQDLFKNKSHELFEIKLKLQHAERKLDELETEIKSIKKELANNKKVKPNF